MGDFVFGALLLCSLLIQLNPSKAQCVPVAAQIFSSDPDETYWSNLPQNSARVTGFDPSAFMRLPTTTAFSFTVRFQPSTLHDGATSPVPKGFFVITPRSPFRSKNYLRFDVLDSSPYAEVKHRTAYSNYDTINDMELGFSRKTNTDMHDLKVVISKSNKQIRIWVDGIQRFDTGTMVAMGWPDYSKTVSWEFGQIGFPSRMSNLVVYASDISSTPGCLACRLGWGSVYPSPCTMCEAGKFSENHMCTDCTANSESAAESTLCSCKPGYVARSDGTCTLPACLPGSSGSDIDSCMLCPPGSEKPLESFAECTLCLAGKFNNVAGSSVCMNCIAGTYSTDVGSRQCKSCLAGSYLNAIGASTNLCIDCPSNTFSTIIGADASDKCLQCPTNTISSTGTKSRDGCVCRSGYEPDPSSTTTTCKICATGSYKDIGDTPCILCDPDMYTSGSGASTCLSCQNGTFGDTNRGDDCSCNAGTQGPKGGPCTLCILGKYSNSTSSGVVKI